MTWENATILLLFPCLSAVACTTAPDGAHHTQAIPAEINEITADPDAWSEKWVVAAGFLRFNEIESWLLTDKNPPRGIYGPDALGIEMSESRQTISKSLDGRFVTVVGQIDIRCVLADRAVRAAQAPDRIVSAGGFCHTSAGPHLIGVTVQQVRSSK
jgi:hypothetical protein